MLQRLRILLTLCFIASLAGCGEESSSTSSLPTGNLYGTAMYTSSSSGYDYSGIKVSLKGTTLSTTTDQHGKWKINNVPTRTYTIVYEKPGFGTMEQHGFVFVGGGDVSVTTMGLYALPTCSVELDAVREDEPGVIMAYAHSVCPTNTHGDMALFYFSNSPNVSKENFTVVRNGSVRSAGTIETEINSADPYYFRELDKTRPIYVVAYHNGGGSYWDPTQDREIYPAIHPQPSRVLSVQLSD